MNVIVPPLKIQGKKTKIVPQIQILTESLIKDKPNIDTWIEPFFGSGVVGFNTPKQIKKIIVSDINPHIINFYKAIQNGELIGDKLKPWLLDMGKKLETGEEDGYVLYREVRDRFNKTKDIKDFLFLSRTSFNGMMRFNKKGEWNLPYCKVPTKLNENIVNTLCNEIDELYKLMQEKKIVFLNQSFEETLKLANDNSIIYCDPPYLGLYTNYFDTWDIENEK
jgi:DNA adenine methylase